MKGTKLILFLLILLTPYFPTYGLKPKDADITNCVITSGVLKETYCTMISSSGYDNCNQLPDAICNQVPGCVFRYGVCTPCPAGTTDKTSDKTTSIYTDYKKEKETCKPCSFSNSNYNDIDYIFEIPGWVLPVTANTESYLCPYTVSCGEGQYYNFTTYKCESCEPGTIKPDKEESTFIPNSTGGIKKVAGCYTCGANSSANPDQNACICDSGYKYHGSNMVVQCSEGTCKPCTYETIRIAYLCDDTYQYDSANTPNYIVNTNISNDCTKTGYTLAGWKCQTCSNSETVYTHGQPFNNPHENIGTDGNIKLVAEFTPKTFTITFKSSTSSDATNCFDPSSFNCTYNDKCTNTNSQNIQAYLYKQGNCAPPTTDTPIFDGWECYKTTATGATVPCSEDPNTKHITYDEIADIIDVETDNVKDDKDNDFKNIINLSGGGNAIFVPKFKKCTNGKYCSLSGVEYDCPAPSTSNYDDINYTQKYDITDCYITKTTKFCPKDQSDPAQCFTLETLGATDDTKIHHVRKSNGTEYAPLAHTTKF